MIKIAFRFIFYKIFAPHRKGFGIHSPFVFHLVSKVLRNHDDISLLEINSWRRELLNVTGILQTSNTGAGSKVHNKHGRSIRQIAVKSSIRHKYGRVLYSLANGFKPATIIELGTGIGVSTVYLAKGCPQSKIISIDSDKIKVSFASDMIKQTGLKNVSLINGSFSEVLKEVLTNAKHPLLVFIDGDHSYAGTLEYFKEIIKYSDPETIIVFDDIRWSDDMERAWSAIKADQAVKVSIDLFFMGIAFFRDGIPKQDFVINF